MIRFSGLTKEEVPRLCAEISDTDFKGMADVKVVPNADNSEFCVEIVPNSGLSNFFNGLFHDNFLGGFGGRFIESI